MNSEQANALYSTIVHNDRELLAQIIEKSKKIFGLDSRGCLVFHVPRSLLTVRQLTVVYLLAHHISHELGFHESPLITSDALGEKTGAKAHTQFELLRLQNQCIIDLDQPPLEPETAENTEEDNEKPAEPPKEYYKIALSNADGVLDDILNTIAAWERKHFYPFTWQERMNNAPYLR